MEIALCRVGRCLDEIVGNTFVFPKELVVLLVKAVTPILPSVSSLFFFFLLEVPQWCIRVCVSLKVLGLLSPAVLSWVCC